MACSGQTIRPSDNGSTLKGIGFLFGIKVFALIFGGEYAKPSLFVVANVLKELTAKDVAINSYKLLNMQVCSFHVFWNRD